MLYNRRMSKKKTPPKILSEYYLLPKGRAKLQAFFEDNGGANYKALKSYRPGRNSAAMDRLIALIKGEPEGTGVLPAEALATLRDILADKSDIALLIHTGAEIEGMGRRKNPKHQDTYSYYISKALYAICAAAETRTESVTRQSHKEYTPYPFGHQLHTDRLTPEKNRDYDPAAPHGDYVMFTSPYNGENAVTEIVQLKQALEAIPSKERESTKVLVHYSSDRHCRELTLEALLANIRSEKVNCSCAIELSEDDPRLDKLRATMYEHSIAPNLQPGDILAVNEKNGMFHCAHRGEARSIAAIPKQNHHSRILFHISGAPGSAVTTSR